MRNLARLLMFSCALLFLAARAPGVVTAVVSQNGPQDPLVVPELGEEWGHATVFPMGERLMSAFVEETNRTACSAWPGDTPDIFNVVVEITNMNFNTSVDGVWYIADQSTTLSNYDGWINGRLAFKIDSVGVNKPLIYESIATDGIFQPYEKWHFIIQDYWNQWALPASNISSIGINSQPDFPGAPFTSSGSIYVPEPAMGALLGIGAVSVLARRWSRRRRRRQRPWK